MTLDEDDIERVAARVVELLQEDTTSAARYVDAAFLAQKLGVDRDWVYAHARELGGVRLGGPRGRLRFDLQKIRRQLDCPDEGRLRTGEQRRARPRKRLPRRLANVDLLPYTELRSTGQIGGRATRQRPRPDNGR
jgi:hypothetical protein